jgi:hypothetical protein
MRCLLPFFIATGFCTWLELTSLCLADKPAPLDYTHPIVRTATFGHTYPGATVPFGMVQLSARSSVFANSLSQNRIKANFNRAFSAGRRMGS